MIPIDTPEEEVVVTETLLQVDDEKTGQMPLKRPEGKGWRFRQSHVYHEHHNDQTSLTFVVAVWTREA